MSIIFPYPYLLAYYLRLLCVVVEAEVVRSGDVASFSGVARTVRSPYERLDMMLLTCSFFG